MPVDLRRRPTRVIDMPWLVAILTLVVAYFAGAVPFGFLVARWRGVNIFEYGSGNIGATNVGRVLGLKFGILVFVLDFAKGAGTVGLALLLKKQFDDDLWSRGYVEVAAGLTAVLGHLFPIYLKFHGGKGVATGFGAVLLLVPIPALAALFVWFVLRCATRYVSLASIAAVVVLCAAYVRQQSAWDWTEPRLWFCLVAGALVLVRHYPNIVRLFRGTENQLEDTIVMSQLNKSLHVLALGMWFGMSVFFTFVVALSLFGTFEDLGQQTERETWFPRPPVYRSVDDEVNGPKEQGTRAAGYAVGPMFLWYFALQGACGFVALVTGLSCTRTPEARVHRWRVNLLIAAVILVLIGWPLQHKVSALRIPRNQATEAYLQDRANQEKLKAMKEARAEFGQWHTYTLLANFATILCVTAAMALAGNLESGSTTIQENSMTGDTKAHEEKKEQECEAE
jgi:acyl-phosphate glycerol 3-phosphate acyltransferase